jgi:hypothetical protein
MEEMLTVRSERLRDHGAVVVTISGGLRRTNRHQVWVAVRQAITECPQAVLVDLTRTALIDPGAVTVFVGLQRGASTHGPGVPLLLCGAAGALAEQLRSICHCRLYETTVEAISAICSGPDGERWLFRRLAPVGASVHVAGVLISDACALWGMPELIHAGRRAVFDLMRVAAWCPPTELHLTAFYRKPELLLSVRSLIPSEHPLWCPPRPRLPEGHHHKRTEIGHIGWTWLPATADTGPELTT